MGDAYVDHMKRSIVWQARCVLWTWVVIALGLFGGVSNKLHWPITPVLILLVVVAAAVVIRCCFGMSGARKDAYAAASAHLGVPVTWRTAPPNGEDAYREWCVRRGVPPRQPNR